MRALPLHAAPLALLIALCAPQLPVHAADAAADVEISRIKLRLPDAAWKVSEPLTFKLAVQDSGLSVGGESRLLVAGDSGTRDTLSMLVTATRGQGMVTMHAECDPQDDLYVRKLNRGQSTFIPLQCLRVDGPARIPADLAKVDDRLAQAMAAQDVAPPPEGYLLTLTVCNENGAMVEIVALVGLDLVGIDGKPAVAPLPQDMPAGVAAWSDTLAEEALGTLSSWSGRMNVPAVAFKAHTPRPESFNTAQAASAAIKD